MREEDKKNYKDRLYSLYAKNEMNIHGFYVNNKYFCYIA